MEYDFKTQIYYIKEISNIFPKANFQWLNHNDVKKIINVLEVVQWRFVGGCVRDSLIGKKTFDIDINTIAKPQRIINLFKSIPGCVVKNIGVQHGTVAIFCKTFKFEITTLRKDVKTFGRKAQVIFGKSWKEDAFRRDFTINSLMLNLKEKCIMDYNHGIQDLLKGEVKFIKDPSKRIKEDFLRIIRFIRFFIRFQKDNIPKEIFEILKLQVDGLEIVKIERIMQEIGCILIDENWIYGIKLIQQLEIDKKIIGTTLNTDFCILNNDFLKNADNNIRMFLIFCNSDEKVISKLPMAHNVKQILFKVSQINEETLNNKIEELLFWTEENLQKLIIKYKILNNNEAVQKLENIYDIITDKNFNVIYKFIQKYIVENYEREKIGSLMNILRIFLQKNINNIKNMKVNDAVNDYKNFMTLYNRI